MAGSRRGKAPLAQRAAFSFAHTVLGRFLIGWIFNRMSFIIPATRLRETSTLLAFYHPQPAYPLHILIVPRRAVRSLEELTAADQDFLSDLFQVVQSLVIELGLEQQGYRLIVNGGRYQTIHQLHFHLISE